MSSVPVSKIEAISNMAVFQDYKNGPDLTFKEVNILYGRNYSGKTTLSRIFRAMELKKIPDKYEKAEFSVIFNNGTPEITHDNLNSCSEVIRVFNEDFVRENLQFYGDDKAINSFAALGADNASIESDISEIQEKIGKPEEDGKKSSGLIRDRDDAIKKHTDEKGLYEQERKFLDDSLASKAKRIKENPLYASRNASYDKAKIKKDIAKVAAESYTAISPDEKERLTNILGEKKKDEIEESSALNLKYAQYSEEAKDLVERELVRASFIQELAENGSLEAWVKEGMGFHKDQRDSCAFCGNDLPADLWQKLGNHFSEEFNKLQTGIKNLNNNIDGEAKRASGLLDIGNKIREKSFYSQFDKDLEGLQLRYEQYSKEYIESLKHLQDQLNARLDSMSSPLVFEEGQSVENYLNQIRDEYEELKVKSNGFTESLEKKQGEARESLKLSEVYEFIEEIDYQKRREGILEKERDVEGLAESVEKIKGEIKRKEEKRKELQGRLSDEGAGAKRVNEYLNHYFGFQNISLEAKKEEGKDSEGHLGADSPQYRFTVMRNGVEAHNLSEGERNLVSFCYFIAKLGDIDTEGKKPVIWIDDPISSLDSNHIYFIYSLIKFEIVQKKKYSQLFLSTHSLEFLRYVKNLKREKKKEKNEEKHKEEEVLVQYLVVERYGKESSIILMPNYLKQYATEFNYLFKQIYNCAKSENEGTVKEDFSCLYNFGNNARKFFEIYLYFKYPSRGSNRDTLKDFFGEDSGIAAELIDRLSNEGSHLKGTSEGKAFGEFAEATAAAQFILKVLKKKDEKQYKELRSSIGEKS